MLRKIPYLTIIACAISIIVSVGMWRTPNCDFPCWYRFGASDLEFIYGGGFWKIYTSAFLHSAWWHLLGNLIFLWSFGKRVELDFGRNTWLILFLISQPVTQASIAIVEGLTGAGISGFTFAMFGYLLIADRQQTLWRTLTARKTYALFVGIMVVLAILFELISLPEFLGLGEFHVAHEAHLAGFLSGLLLGNFFLRRRTVWAGVGAAILPVLAVILLLYHPTSFWWQMARDHEKQVLLYLNLDLLSCEVRPSLTTEERPKYSPVIINLEHKLYNVVAISADGTVQSSRLFIIDYDSLTVHNAYRTIAKYANIYDPSIGQLYEIRDDGGNCLGRFMPKHTDYNIIVFR